MKQDVLEELAKRLQLVRNYVDRLNGQQISEEERIFLAGGPVLWKTEDGAKFERDNPQVIAKMRQITQDIHRILKG